MDDATKARFRARRYMDDLLLLYYKADDTWDHERFCDDIQTGCYMPPLKLEDSKDGTFLENTFRIGLVLPKGVACGRKPELKATAVPTFSKRHSTSVRMVPK